MRQSCNTIPHAFSLYKYIENIHREAHQNDWIIYLGVEGGERTHSTIRGRRDFSLNYNSLMFQTDTVFTYYLRFSEWMSNIHRAIALWSLHQMLFTCLDQPFASIIYWASRFSALQDEIWFLLPLFWFFSELALKHPVQCPSFPCWGTNLLKCLSCTFSEL